MVFQKKEHNILFCSSGFTLVELMITIAVVGVLLTVGVPSFTQSIQSNRLVTYANEFLTALNFARSEAIKQGVQVTMLRKGSTATRWEDGWEVFVDSDGDETFSDDGDSTLCETTAAGFPSEDCLLKTYPALTSGFTLRTQNSTYKNYIAFDSSGLSTMTVGDTFRLCDSSADTAKSRSIAINAVGRARVYTGTTSCP